MVQRDGVYQQLSGAFRGCHNHWVVREALLHLDVFAMNVLEDIKPSNRVQGIILDESVEVIAVEWFGDQAINITYRTATGSTGENVFFRSDEQNLTVMSRGCQWSFDGDGWLLRLVTEANRIKLAHFFDPYLAIHTSLVDPLLHQISAVHGRSSSATAVFAG